MESSVNGSQPWGTVLGWSWVKRFLRSFNGHCVEVGKLPDGDIGIRDSKNPEGPVTRFTPDEWDAFLRRVRYGDFNSLEPMASPRPPGHDNRYSFLKWVLENPWRTLGLALLLAVAVTAAVLAPHLLALFP